MKFAAHRQALREQCRMRKMHMMRMIRMRRKSAVLLLTAFVAGAVPVLQGCGAAQSGASQAAGTADTAVSTAAVSAATSQQARKILSFRTARLDFVNDRDGFLLIGENTVGGGSSDLALLKTADGGKTWKAVARDSDVANIAFQDEKNGYGIDAGSERLVKTADGGETWSPVPSVATQTIADISVMGGTLFIQQQAQSSMASVSFRFSGNGGGLWGVVKAPGTAAEKDTARSPEAYAAVTQTQGYMLLSERLSGASEYKTLCYTADGGKTWSVRSRSQDPSGGEGAGSVGTVGTTGTNGAMQFFPDNVGYIYYSGLSILMKSTDGGVNFGAVVDGQSLRAVSRPDFLTGSRGYLFLQDSTGSDSSVYLAATQDGGKSWTKTAAGSIFTAALR